MQVSQGDMDGGKGEGGEVVCRGVPLRLSLSSSRSPLYTPDESDSPMEGGAVWKRYR